MPSLITCSTKTANAGVRATMCRQRSEHINTPDSSYVFSTNKQGGLIPADFLPFPNKDICMHSFDSNPRDDIANKLTNKLPIRVATLKFMDEHPVNKLNYDFWYRVRRACSSTNTYNETEESWYQFLKSSYYERSISELSGHSDITSYKPKLQIATSNRIDITNAVLWRMYHASLFTALRPVRCNRTRTNLGIGGKTTWLSPKDGNDYIAFCVMLKSEHYNDWLNAVYKDCRPIGRYIRGSSSEIHKTIELHNYKNTLDFSYSFDPKWFTIIIDRNIMSSLRNSEHGSLFKEYDTIVLNPLIELGVDVEYLSSSKALTQYTEKEDIEDLRTYIKGNLLDYEKKGKDFLASISKTLKGRLQA